MESKDRLLQELKSLETKIASHVGKQAEEIAKLGGTTSQTASQLGALEAKHDEYQRELKEMTKAIEGLETKLGRPNYGQPAGRKSAASEFVRSSKFQSMIERKARTCDPVELGSLRGYKGFEQKSLAGNDQLRNVMSLDLLQNFYADPLRPNRVRDLFPVFPTRFSLIEFVRENVLNINAAMVAEGTQKPESNISFVDASTQVRTLAHWMGIPRQLLDDINALETYLESRLMQGLKMVEDTQLLYGDGTGSNLLGLLNTPGIQTYAWSAGTHGDTQLDAIRRGITYAQKAYYPVDGIVMSPTNWEQIELTKSTEGLYVWVNVATGATPALWKVPVVTTTAINDGDVLLGAFGLGAAIWDREDANMRISEHHADFFTKNMVALLLEERVALTTFRPKSFVKVSLDVAPA